VTLASIPIVATPNHGGVRVRTDLCVWHATAGGTALSSLQWIARPKSGAGYHYVIERDGEITGSTPHGMIAYHAGESAWPVPASGVPKGMSVNRRSLGISFANRNDGSESVTVAQVDAAMRLLALLIPVYPALKAVTAHVRHRDVSPGRKSDPLPSALNWMAFLQRIRGMTA
jgi:N-acetyl-anhydromuramyl-L-alanine amidase AmpD